MEVRLRQSGCLAELHRPERSFSPIGAWATETIQGWRRIRTMNWQRVKCLADFGGMLSFQIRGGSKEAMGVAGLLRLFTRATSLGGAHSLIEHRASVEGSKSKTPRNLLRMSVGIENAEDLIADLEQAL